MTTKKDLIVEHNRLPDRQECHQSPDGTHLLTIDQYRTGEGTWNYSRGLVSCGERVIADVKRNYPAFPFSWVEAHDGKTYLYCGEDYQGQTFVDLATGERRDVLPKSAEKGWGFCWAAHHPGPKGSRYFAVTGCFWACSYEVWIFDITDPMCPKRIWRGDGEFGGWDSADSCTIARYTYQVVNLPGHPLHGKPAHELSVEQDEEVEAEAGKRGLEDWLDVVEKTAHLSFPRDVQRNDEGSES